MCGINALLNHRAEIRRRAAGVDAYGRESGAFSSLGTFPCWIAPSTAKEVSESISGQTILHTGYFEVSSGLLASDQIVWGARLFDVATVRNYYNSYLSAELREVTT